MFLTAKVFLHQEAFRADAGFLPQFHLLKLQQEDMARLVSFAWKIVYAAVPSFKFWYPFFTVRAPYFHGSLPPNFWCARGFGGLPWSHTQCRRWELLRCQLPSRWLAWIPEVHWGQPRRQSSFDVREYQDVQMFYFPRQVRVAEVPIYWENRFRKGPSSNTSRYLAK